MKHFLVAGTVFLMIAFVGGSALTQWLAPDYSTEDVVRGQAYGREITFGDMQPAFVQATVLSRVVPYWDVPWAHLLTGMGGLNQQNLQMLMYQLRPEPLTDEEWYMLLLAAEKHDTFVSEQQIANYKERFGLTPERTAQLRDNLHVSTSQIDNAVASYIRVLQDANQAVSAVVASEADIQEIIRQTQQRIDADALIIDSANFVDESYEPTQEELQALYDEYKDEPKPRAATGITFGYQLPAEVRMEYIRIDADALKDQQDVSVDDAFEYWEANQNQFFKPQTQPAEGEAPAPRDTYKTFSAAKPDVIDKLKTQKARNEAVSIARGIITRLSMPWANQPTTQPGGYKEIPVAQREAGVYPDVVESLRNEYPDALSFTRTDYMTLDDLNTDAELARAFAGSGQSRTSLARAAFFVPDSGISRENAQANARLFRNLYETAPDPFIGGSGAYEGDAYVMRTVAVHQPAAPPLEEIRDQLVTDVRKKRAYEQAGELARELASAVNKDHPLREAFLADETLSEKLPRTAFKEPEPFALSRLYGGGQMMPRVMPNYIRELGYDPGLMEKVSDLVETHRKEDSRPAMAYAQDNQGRWLVIQIGDVLPVTEDTYANNREMAMGYVRLNMMLEVINRWFDAGQIRARVEWKDAEGQDEDDALAEEGEAQPAAADEAA